MSHKIVYADELKEHGWTGKDGQFRISPNDFDLKDDEFIEIRMRRLGHPEGDYVFGLFKIAAIEMRYHGDTVYVIDSKPVMNARELEKEQK